MFGEAFRDRQKPRVLVLGLGESGLAMARWCARHGCRLRVADTRAAPPNRARLSQLAQLGARFVAQPAAHLVAQVPTQPASQVPAPLAAQSESATQLSGQDDAVEFVGGPFSPALLDGIELVALSPGLSPFSADLAPLVASAHERGIPVWGELEFFAQALRTLGGHGYAPGVIAITGTNGKTTTTSLTGMLCARAGKRVAVAGNISPALLDKLAEAIDQTALPDVWVLELSSFQLQGARTFEPDAAAVLNITQDHLDWHGGFDAYAGAKGRIFGARTTRVLNRDDARVMAFAAGETRGEARLGAQLGAQPSGTQPGAWLDPQLDATPDAPSGEKLGAKLGTQPSGTQPGAWLDPQLDAMPGAQSGEKLGAQLGAQSGELGEQPDMRAEAQSAQPGAPLSAQSSARSSAQPSARSKKNAPSNHEAAAAHAASAATVVTFGLNEPQREGDFGLLRENGMMWLVEAYARDAVDEPAPPARRRKSGAAALGAAPDLALKRLMPVDALRIRGLHNAANALAAFALARAIGLPAAPLLHGLREYRGEPHRVELIASLDGIDYVDDSKGTNVGATVAALDGLAQRAVLIAGGDGKGQDFAPLAAPVARWCRAVLLIGRDAPRIRAALASTGIALDEQPTLEAATRAATALAQAGDAILLSPACASFDMFDDYAHRAAVFRGAVTEIAAERGTTI